MEEEKVNSGYFRLIHDQLTIIKTRAPWANQVLGQLQQLEMDIRFMKMLCLCLDTFHEESRERLGPMMITPFEMIWLKDHQGLSESLLKRLAETRRPVDMLIEDYNPAVFELKGKIVQSKQKFEGWCEILMQSSTNCCQFSSFSEIRYYVRHVRNCLKYFSRYRIAPRIAPLKEQINILIVKIAFLEESLRNVESCPNGRNEILQFLNFAVAFANSAACFAILYWSKDDNEETASEMNAFLFDIFRKFIPLSSDIIPLYIGILKSYDLQQSDSFLLGEEAVESFVDFFFEQMDTILKEDDFLILRDRLTFLLTFLIDPPPRVIVNDAAAAAEEDLIRSQIYAFFHKDAYLLLPFDKMKDDFSDKKKLLGDCMIKIDIAIAKIRALHYGFTDSWIRLEEVEKMEYVYFVSVQRELSWIEKHARWADPVLGQLQLYKTELRFLRVFLLCFTTWDDIDEEISVGLSSMITSLHGIWGEKEEKGLLARRLHVIRTRGGLTDWHPLAFEIEGKIQLSKLEIESWWLNLFDRSFRCKPSTTYRTLKCLDSIIKNLKDLVTHKAGEIVSFKKQIETLEGKVTFLKIFLKLTVNCINSKNLGEFNMFVQAFTNDAACLTFLYWAKDANDDKILSETNLVLSHMLQKVKPTTSDVARLYFETLKAIYVQGSDSLMFGQTVVSFVGLFLEDDFQVLRDDVVFLLTFLNDPPNKNAKELICRQIGDLFGRVCTVFSRLMTLKEIYPRKMCL